MGLGINFKFGILMKLPSIHLIKNSESFLTLFSSGVNFFLNFRTLKFTNFFSPHGKTF